MQIRILLAYFFIMSFPIISFATFRPVVALSSGLAITNVYSSTVIDFAPFQNSYIGRNHYNTQFDSGLFMGVETAFSCNFTTQIGLEYFVNSSFKESGSVYQFTDPLFNNLAYRYKIQSRRISLAAKISRAFRQIWHPYISASMGSASNKAFHYTEYPVTSADVPMAQPFDNHTTSAFTYSIGIGADVDVAEHWRLGAGYRFVDLGKACLGVSPLQSSTETICSTHMNANEILVQISYLG